METNRYDVIIVGAGIIGLSAAYHIKENNPGTSVLVVERKAAPVQGDTAKSVAAVRDTFTSDVNRLFAGSTIDFYKHVQTDLGFNINLDLISYLWLLDAHQFKTFEGIENGMREHGIRFRVLDRAELAEHIPDLVLDPASEESKIMGLTGVHKAVQGLDCGTVAPELVSKFYEDEYRRMGGEFLLGTEVTSIRVVAKDQLGLPGEPFVWQEKVFGGIETGKGFIAADTVVLASGARAPFLLDRLGIDGLVRPKKRQVFQLRSESLNRLLDTKGLNEQNVLPFTILPRGGVYLRPLKRERSFWVAAADDIGRPFSYEEEPTAEENYYTYNVHPILSEYLPCFTNLRPMNSWAGLYDINSLDSTPIIERISNCIIATGMSGSGIMKSDAVGRVVDALYQHRDEAALFGNKKINVSRIGLENRSVGKEEFVI
jgi:FAD-dependent oxidoreductase domain-containing protein 1